MLKYSKIYILRYLFLEWGMDMGKKIVAAFLVLIIGTCMLTSCNLLAGLPFLFYAVGEAHEHSYGEPDRTGSYGQINQSLYRPENWKQIVEESSFQLEEKFITEYDTFGWKYGSYPSIDGSTVTVPMSVEFARQHLGLNDDEMMEFVWHNTTPDAYENLIYGRDNWGNTSSWMDDYGEDVEEFRPVDIILVTEPSDNELRLAEKQKVKLIIEPVCCDAFVFITHKDNPVDSLTVEQVQKIYTGEITNWNELGGKDEQIKAYQREADSGSQTTMEQRVMKGKKMLPAPQIEIEEGMAGLIEAVAEYQNDTFSIGYTFLYYIDTLYKNDSIKTIRIDGIEPSAQNIKTAKYLFSTHYYGVIREEDRNLTGGKFLDWILSKEGQACIEQAGYVKLK